MINLQLGSRAAILGGNGRKDQILPALLAKRCACCGDALHLSDTEIVTDFVVCDPQEAHVGSWPREIKLRMGDEQQLTLIRWKDGIQSLVVFSASGNVPSPETPTAAYWNALSFDYAEQALCTVAKAS